MTIPSSAKRERELQELERARRLHVDRAERAWLASVPEPCAHGDLDSLLASRVEGRIRKSDARTVSSFVESPSRFLLLKGDKGLGKSTLAVAIGTEMLRRGSQRPMYRSLPSLLYDFSWGSQHDPVGECSKPGLLILDDVGAGVEGTTPQQQRCLWSLIDNRWGLRGRHTILTTNMSVNGGESGQGLREWLGETAWDRVQDGLAMVEFHGVSLRD